MRFWSTWRLLVQFISKPIQGSTHVERLNSFYGYQAAEYDAFRKKFLRGRDALAARLIFTPHSRWCDLGCGTGYLLELVPPSARDCQEIILVDLCEPLLNQARQRIKSKNWSNCHIVSADTTSFQPDRQVDIVTISYSLSMTPDWFATIDQAYQMLKPGGILGVVDFYVARKYPPLKGAMPQPFWTRHFWPIWFDTDNVKPCADHMPYLAQRFEIESLEVGRTSVPGMPWFRPPYFVFLGSRQ